MFVHARAPFERRDLAEEWVRVSRTLGFASLVELTHTLLQPFVFLREISAADLQFFCRWAVARKRTVVCQDVTDTWSDDSAERVRLATNLPEAISSAALQCAII